MEFLDFLKNLYSSDHGKYIIIPLNFSVAYYYIKEVISGMKDKAHPDYSKDLEEITK